MGTEMIILKACPRCSGDLFSGLEDELNCMQCGKVVDADERERLMLRVRPVSPRAAAGA
jgi:uncharacterized protein (DUF983 family)